MNFKDYCLKRGITSATKEAMSPQELGELHSDFQAALNAELKSLIDKKGDSETITKLQAQVDAFGEMVSKEVFTKLENSYKTIAEEVTKLKNGTAANSAENPYTSFVAQVNENLEAIKSVRKNATGAVTLTIKAAGITGTVAIGAGTASLTNGQSAASSLAEGGEIIYNLQRIQPSVLDFVNVTPTNSRHITFRNEVAAEGDFAITAEGAAKPLRQYKFAKASSDAVKVAAHTIITDEFELDHPRLWAMIQDLMRNDCNIEMGELIMTDMITNAAPYSLNALDGAIDNADDFAAIGAVICQLQLLGYRPNVLALNPADVWRFRLQKGEDGHYVMPPFNWNGSTYEFGSVYVDPTVTAGNFFLGDGSNYKVELVGDVIIRMGYINDQLITNEMTLVVERYFHNYIPAARRSGFVYANFATVKADIELV